MGKSISLNGTPFEIVGVMHEGFHGIKQELVPADLWVPISMQATVLQFPSLLTPGSGLYFLHLFGRLRENAVTDKAEFLRNQNWLNERSVTASATVRVQRSLLNASGRLTVRLFL